ncbi:MAG: TRAP transporter substrate-binding protein DctP [Ferrovibrio sp.]|uniref:TRAP transporter substrate-binding protein DctP n=1 Tax=Ferrovibrio sp. TaxID=1917215 RepID=UPI00261112B8|nr:TRAP transporter substrate-binding protein DctP [Ferrovibrio sp.]MCW0234286.1 TRAP transporter substrate-binding protein DctP [Ferrovibrio sp.]
MSSTKRAWSLKKRVAASLAVAGMLLAGAGTAHSAETLSYATYFGANDPLVQVDTWFMKEVEKRTNGAVKFDTFLGGAMFGGPEIYPGMSRRAVDMGMSVPAAFQPTDYVLSNVTLPYITDDSVAVTYAFNQLAQKSPALQKEYANQNVKLLYALGFSENTIWSTKPIRKVEDLKGMRIRSVMSIADGLKILGAVPVSMGFGDAVGALQRQVIDGFSSAPFLTSISVGLHDFAPYVSDGGGMGVYAVSSTSINLDTWKKLPPNVQKVMEEVAAKVPDHYAAIMDGMVDKAVDAVIAAGKTQVVLMSVEEKARVRDAVAKPLWDKWLMAANQRGIDGSAFLDQYRQLVSEHVGNHNYLPGLERYAKKKK